MSMSKSEASDDYGVGSNIVEGNGKLINSASNSNSSSSSSSSSSKPKLKLKPAHQGESKSTLPPPKPLKPLKGLGLSRGAALPPIRAGAGHDTPDDRERQLKALEDMEKELEAKRKEAEMVIRQGKQQRAEQQAQERKMRQELEAALQGGGGSGNVDKMEAEMERRATQMKEQRDRLVAMKKAERAKKVAEEEERNAKKNDELKERMLESAPTEFIEQQRRKEGLEAKESGYGGPSKEEIEEGRRGAMRNALARRMKMNLILGEEERVARAQHEQLLDLEKKLNEVETLRSDSKAVSDLLI